MGGEREGVRGEAVWLLDDFLEVQFSAKDHPSTLIRGVSGDASGRVIFFEPCLSALSALSASVGLLSGSVGLCRRFVGSVV